MYKDMVFCLLQKILEISRVKKLISSAKNFSKSKCGGALKKEGLKFAKTSGKQILKKAA